MSAFPFGESSERDAQYTCLACGQTFRGLRAYKHHKSQARHRDEGEVVR